MKKYLLSFYLLLLCFSLSFAQNPLAISKSDENILSEKVKEFIKDYYIKLNKLGNPDIFEEDFELERYFPSGELQIYNDLFPHIKREEFPVRDYFIYVDKWFNMGVKFEILAIDVLPKFENKKEGIIMSCVVKRKLFVNSKEYKNIEKLIFKVKFAIDNPNPLIVSINQYKK